MEKKIGYINVDTIIYKKTNVDENKVNNFVEYLKVGFKFPPILVQLNNGTYNLIDGLHVVEACKKIGKKKVLAIVVPEIK